MCRGCRDCRGFRGYRGSRVLPNAAIAGRHGDRVLTFAQRGSCNGFSRGQRCAVDMVGALRMAAASKAWSWAPKRQRRSPTRGEEACQALPLGRAGRRAVGSGGRNETADGYRPRPLAACRPLGHGARPGEAGRHGGGAFRVGRLRPSGLGRHESDPLSIHLARVRRGDGIAV